MVAMKVQEGSNDRGSIMVQMGSWSKFEDNYEVQL